MKIPSHRRLALIGVILSFHINCSSQIISEITHEQFRDKVLISYNLNGVSANQRLEVNAYCSVDNFKQELSAVSGNGIGATVTGNGQKTIIWDVLHARPELIGIISFEIRALVYSDFHPNATPATSTQGETTEQKKANTYSVMASALGNFIIQGKDLVVAFRRVNKDIYEDNVSLRKITDAVINYNTAFNAMNSTRMSLEKEVLTYWNNEALYNDVRYLFDFALGELHTVNVLELNNTLNLINDINLGKITGRKNEREANEKVMASVVQNTNQLEKRMIELERRANRILYTLSTR